MEEGGFLRKAKNTEFSVPRGSKVGPRKGYSSNPEFRLGMMRIQRFIDLYLSKMVRGVDSILQLSR